MREDNFIDRLIVEFDSALRALLAPASRGGRPVPGGGLDEPVMSTEERRHAGALMRVNHCGEVCAQALYQGQSLTSSNPDTRQALREAAQEEIEHLAWTSKRIAELGGRQSLLNPLWYSGSLFLGAVAGTLGDAFNLGFLAETERQVCAHLDSHLARLPSQDAKSRAILGQMRADEAAHASMAISLGGKELPPAVRGLMKLSSRIMTRSAYYL